MIDLSTCVPGQRVEFRDGTTGEYYEFNEYLTYGHFTRPDGERLRTHLQNGCFSNAVEHNFDVIKIYPRETPEEPSMIDLSTCVYGQKIEYRNGKTGEYLALNINSVYPYTTRPFNPIPNTDPYITHKKNGHHSDFPDGHGYDVVKILPLETQMTDKSTESQVVRNKVDVCTWNESQVVRSKIDVFEWVNPTNENETHRVEVTVDDLGVFITSCEKSVREDISIANKDLAIAVAKAILEGYSQ